MGVPAIGRSYYHHTSNIAYREYSQEAFDLAARENKPVFMVLSAVWCFWCKVYERQTLEKLEVSAYLNRNFINVFVDLDQRQDLQHLYVSKGIPTTVIFTPEGKRFLTFSGTLKQEEFLSGMRQVLAEIRKNAPERKAETAPSVKDVRALLIEARAASMKEGAPPAGAPAPLGRLASRKHAQFVEVALDSFDEEYGGFGLGRKYPLARVVQYFLEPRGGQEDQEALGAVLATLDRVSRHLYDPIEGGFHRYGDTRRWSDPHYEKMLVTNVNLLRAYQLAAGRAAARRQPRKERKYEDIYRKSLEFFLNTFVPRRGGGLSGSLDGKDKKYYRLPAGKRARARKPALDATVYTAWNGEAVYVLSEMYKTDPAPRLLSVLKATLDFLRKKMMSEGQGMYSYYKPGHKRPVRLGQLKDNSWGALAFIAGYQLTGRREYLEAFTSILAWSRARLFSAEAGAYRLWNVPAPAGLRRGEHISAEVPLAENGVMALALVNAYQVTKNSVYRRQARELLLSLAALDARLFEEDPGDSGRRFLAAFVYYLKALHRLSRLES